MGSSDQTLGYFETLQWRLASAGLQSDRTRLYSDDLDGQWRWGVHEFQCDWAGTLHSSLHCCLWSGRQGRQSDSVHSAVSDGSLEDSSFRSDRSTSSIAPIVEQLNPGLLSLLLRLRPLGQFVGTDSHDLRPLPPVLVSRGWYPSHVQMNHSSRLSSGNGNRTSDVSQSSPLRFHDGVDLAGM